MSELLREVILHQLGWAQQNSVRSFSTHRLGHIPKDPDLLGLR